MALDAIDAGSLYLQNSTYDRLTNMAVSRGSTGEASGSPGVPGGFDKIMKGLAAEKSENRKPVIDKSGELYEQCEALETFLVKNILTGMRNTIQKSGLIDEGFAGKMYEDMLYDEYARDFTKNAGLGLAELAYLELTGQRGKIIAGHG
jgi:Rod binding domain-containing protein